MQCRLAVQEERFTRRLLKAAYNVADFQIVGPNIRALVSDRFDIVAKTSHETSRSELMSMMRQLLQDRFKLAFHREMRRRSVFKLKRAKRPLALVRATQARDLVTLRHNSVLFGGVTMGRLADFLSGLESVNRPVVDYTGLEGQFDFTIKMAYSGAEHAELGDEHAIYAWDAIFHDIQQIGLRLVRAQDTIDVLIIDRIELPEAN